MIGGGSDGSLRRRLESAEKHIESLQAVRDKNEIEREQLEQILEDERSLRVKAEEARHSFEAQLNEVMEVRVDATVPLLMPVVGLTGGFMASNVLRWGLE
jgi:siderophore synthetase component